MAKIIYKRGMEGQNRLSCIKGIEIGLLNEQKALIYPKYAERQMLTAEQINRWNAPNETETGALKVTNTSFATERLRDIGSPAAEWVSQFKYARYSNFALPSLLAALEIQHQKKEIDALAETIEGADLLKDYSPNVCSCSRHSKSEGWFALGFRGSVSSNSLDYNYLAVPTIIYNYL